MEKAQKILNIILDKINTNLWNKDKSEIILSIEEEEKLLIEVNSIIRNVGVTYIDICHSNSNEIGIPKIPHLSFDVSQEVKLTEEQITESLKSHNIPTDFSYRQAFHAGLNYVSQEVKPEGWKTAEPVLIQKLEEAENTLENIANAHTEVLDALDLTQIAQIYLDSRSQTPPLSSVKVQETISEEEIKKFARSAFSAGRTYQMGEYSEYHGGHEHEYPDYPQWFKKNKSSLSSLSQPKQGVTEESIKELLHKRELLENKIFELDKKALINYELEKLQGYHKQEVTEQKTAEEKAYVCSNCDNSCGANGSTKRCQSNESQYMPTPNKQKIADETDEYLVEEYENDLVNCLSCSKDVPRKYSVEDASGEEVCMPCHLHLMETDPEYYTPEALLSPSHGISDQDVVESFRQAVVDTWKENGSNHIEREGELIQLLSHSALRSKLKGVNNG